MIYKEITDYIVNLIDSDQEFVFQGMKYIFEVQDEFDLKSIAKTLKKQGVKESDLIMTMADKLRQEGREEGIKEGKFEIARNMLKNGMSIEEIIELTNLDREKIQILKEDIKH